MSSYKNILVAIDGSYESELAFERVSVSHLEMMLICFFNTCR